MSIPAICILNQAWSPIGGITFYRGTAGRRSTLSDPVIVEIAAACGKSPAQVMLRWHLQRDLRTPFAAAGVLVVLQPPPAVLVNPGQSGRNGVVGGGIRAAPVP